MPTKDFGVWTADDCALVLIDTTTWIETATPELDWLNKAVFITVGGRRPGGVIYDTYLVA